MFNRCLLNTCNTHTHNTVHIHVYTSLYNEQYCVYGCPRRMIYQLLMKASNKSIKKLNVFIDWPLLSLWACLLLLAFDCSVLFRVFLSVDAVVVYFYLVVHLLTLSNNYSQVGRLSTHSHCCC